MHPLKGKTVKIKPKSRIPGRDGQPVGEHGHDNENLIHKVCEMGVGMGMGMEMGMGMGMRE